MAALKPSGALVLLSVACLTIMVGCVIVPGLPSIAAGLGVPDAASWLVTLPSLGVVLFGPFVGRLIATCGTRRTLCIGLFLYGALGLSCIWLSGAVAVFTNRLLLGGATAIVIAAGTGLISEFYEGQARLRMIARQGMAIELGGVVFLFIGGLLAELGWQWPFLLYVVAWFLLGLVLAFIPNRRAPAVSAAGTPATFSWMRIADTYLVALFSMIVFFVAVIMLPPRLHALGMSETETGYLLSFVSLVAVGAAFLMPQVLRWLGENNTLIAGFLAYAVAHMFFIGASTIGGIALGSILLGSGFGLTIPLVNHMTIERTHPQQRGHALAYLSVAIFLGQFLSSFVDLLPASIAVVFGAPAAIAIPTALCLGMTGLLRRPKAA